jgi:transketolase
MAVQEVSPRETYGQVVAELGDSNKNIVVLDADLSHSTMTKFFAAKHPERFFNCGIAEANMIGIAAGFAAAGKIPFASTFAVFAPGRCFDQVRMAVVQPRMNVKIVTTHGGITVGEDGSSHQAIEDLSLACSLVGLTVIVPADAIETTQVIKYAIATEGPMLIRLSRAKVPVVYDNNYRFEVGKAATLREGKDATIITNGLMVAPALETADKLKQEGLTCRVLNMHTLSPIDEAAIVKAAKETGAIVTAEEHLVHGALSSIVSQVVVKNQPVPVEFVAMTGYAQSGKPNELLARYGLTAKDIEAAVRKAIARKEGFINV